MPGPGEAILHYRLLEPLGTGGGGVVWKAVDQRLGRPVAVKFLAEPIAGDVEALARLEAEARVLATLSHPNIVTVYALEEAGGQRFVAMELVQGKTFDELIPPGGLPLERLLELAVPVADALAAAHERGVTHRDLKPRNVMLGDDGRVKVLDFGLARRETQHLDITSSPTRTFRTDVLAGTLAYMSPEQVQGRDLDPRSDIFSFGVLLYEMATGRRPFLGASAGELIAAILRDTPALPSALRAELPRELDQVVTRCLEKDPRRRKQSSLDLREELKALQRQPAGGDRPPVASVAVLPFRDLSREQDLGYLCEGVAEEIIGTLARQPSLRVASRRSSFLYRGADLDARELGRRLSAAGLVEGSVRKEGQRLRISAELTDTATNYQLWNQTYDRELHDVFAIEEDIARGVAEALEVVLAPSQGAARPAAGTRDVAAYEYYLRGRSFYFQYRRQAIEFALELYSHALTRDPLYARAYAGCADCCAYLFLYSGRDPAHRERAEQCSRRALELEPELAEAHASRGVVLSLQGRDSEAEAAFESAVRLNPRLFEAHYFHARHCFARGQLEQAARLFEQAALAWPEDFQAPLLVAQVHDACGQPRLAEAARRRGLALAEERLRLSPEDARARYMGANALVALGERERGLDWARRALEADADEPMTLYNIGCIRALAGEADGALDCLERAAARGLTERGWFENDSNLDSLRTLPRFQALVAGLPESAGSSSR